jgi:hypothetical protein
MKRGSRTGSEALKPLLEVPIALKTANNNHESTGLKTGLEAKKASPTDLSL